MKKSILSIMLLLVVATVTNAAPRFGVIGEQNSGLGAFVTDDMYNAQVTFTNSGNDTDGNPSETAVKIAGNYKVAIDSVTSFTVGAGYTILSGDFDPNGLGTGDNAFEHDGSNILALSAGFERALSANLVLTAQTDVYSVYTIKEKGSSSDTRVTSLFSNNRIGVAYLF